MARWVGSAERKAGRTSRLRPRDWPFFGAVKPSRQTLDTQLRNIDMEEPPACHRAFRRLVIRRTMRIAHLSDLHFGRIAHPEIVDVLVDEVNQNNVDLVVISGDLTQRALRSQYRDAARVLRSIAAPMVVVPGNHDVLAWWRPLSRMARPLSRYRRFISRDLTMSQQDDTVAVLGVNSAYGATIKGGWIRSSVREAIRAYFEAQPATRFKILVVHHPLIPVPLLSSKRAVARGGESALRVAEEAGVELVLCGHLHVSHVESLKRHDGQDGLVVACAGTVTSSRGRRSNRNKNYYNIVEVDADAFTIAERCYDPAAQRFDTVRTSTFARLIGG